MKSAALLSLSLLSFAAMSSASDTPVPDGMPTYQQFENKVRLYPYQASPERAQKIRAGSGQLQNCMNKQQVSALLGLPDFSQLSYGPKGPREKWLGSTWVYYLAKQNSSTNLNDPNIEIFFDTTDRAQWIVPSHIKGARELGSPKHQCSQQGASGDGPPPAGSAST